MGRSIRIFSAALTFGAVFTVPILAIQICKPLVRNLAVESHQFSLHEARDVAVVFPQVWSVFEKRIDQWIKSQGLKNLDRDLVRFEIRTLVRKAVTTAITGTRDNAGSGSKRMGARTDLQEFVSYVARAIPFLMTPDERVEDLMTSIAPKIRSTLMARAKRNSDWSGAPPESFMMQFERDAAALLRKFVDQEPAEVWNSVGVTTSRKRQIDYFSAKILQHIPLTEVEKEKFNRLYQDIERMILFPAGKFGYLIGSFSMNNGIWDGGRAEDFVHRIHLELMRIIRNDRKPFDPALFPGDHPPEVAEKYFYYERVGSALRGFVHRRWHRREMVSIDDFMPGLDKDTTYASIISQKRRTRDENGAVHFHDVERDPFDAAALKEGTSQWFQRVDDPFVLTMAQQAAIWTISEVGSIRGVYQGNQQFIRNILENLNSAERELAEHSVAERSFILAARKLSYLTPGKKDPRAYYDRALVYVRDLGLASPTVQWLKDRDGERSAPVGRVASDLEFWIEFETDGVEVRGFQFDDLGLSSRAALVETRLENSILEQFFNISSNERKNLKSLVTDFQMNQWVDSETMRYVALSTHSQVKAIFEKMGSAQKRKFSEAVLIFQRRLQRFAREQGIELDARPRWWF